MKKDNKAIEKEVVFTEFVVDDASYKTQLNKMYHKRKPYQPANPSHLKSFMPGNIPEVFVKEGDEVKEGDILLILEAMKMKNHILAPFDGIVTAINVEVGAKVPKNHILLEVKPLE
ncbi:MAG: acetyl-CoA carboxylase biotin carboxyl carrier protein subunit [Bacteroidota bacterium]